ncbi:MAG TPA: response regulator transcription factor [Acidobacteriaceae bacterium]|nr:response regulator transcription factor [Acidobacteriaceae bacterium]
MIEAIRAVSRGRRYFPHHIAEKLAERMMRAELTSREIEVLQMLAHGLTNKEIGTALRISENTVRKHVKSIIEKLEVSDRTEAATCAIYRGIIGSPLESASACSIVLPVSAGLAGLRSLTAIATGQCRSH